ncbi:MAG: DUF1343 domain-containing protein [Cytophagaceae bacterium]|nr:DUF1343 domain-containing protein [Cytophagaceae bacterium]
MSILLLSWLVYCHSLAQTPLPGAFQTEAYLPLLKDKRVALVVNQTSVVGTTHLADTLLALGISVKKVFAPEHGFRGEADAGEHVANQKDSKTGLPVISLFGDKKEPSSADLADVDVVVFDIQDVGVRFYTYISTMHYCMQACARYKKTMLVLDRPNPNGHYVAGPVLEKKFKSFVGMHPIPIVHGLTVGELAGMINGEKWLDSSGTCHLKVIPVTRYSHKDAWSLSIKPSPNLPNDLSIQFYPYLCLFEGTIISVGRGTEAPFQQIGAPNTAYGKDRFTPVSLAGAKKPMYENTQCYGIDLRKRYPEQGFQLRYLLEMYRNCPEKEKFFNSFFNKLAGNSSLQAQIKANASESEIINSWKPSLEAYKKLRKKYLLYPDFE